VENNLKEIQNEFDEIKKDLTADEAQNLGKALRKLTKWFCAVRETIRAGLSLLKTSLPALPTAAPFSISTSNPSPIRRCPRATAAFACCLNHRDRAKRDAALQDRTSARPREYRLGRPALRNMRLHVVLADDACRGTCAEFDEIARLLAAIGKNRDDAVGALRCRRHEDGRMQADILPDRKEMTRQRITGSARDILAI
jgi:hypothetical protein